MPQVAITKGATISKETMEGLKQYEGRRIKVEFVKSHEAKPFIAEGVLNYVQLDCPGYNLIRMEFHNLPFVGMSQAIRTISVDNRIVYDNRANVQETYGSLSVPEQEALYKKTFGEPEENVPKIRTCG